MMKTSYRVEQFVFSYVPFKNPKKALARCIIGTMTDRTHGAHQRIFTKQSLVIATSKLTVSIRM